jgi:hypothetical protein
MRRISENDPLFILEYKSARRQQFFCVCVQLGENPVGNRPRHQVVTTRLNLDTDRYKVVISFGSRLKE